MACDMPEPCKFLSLDNCQKGSLWAHKEADLSLDNCQKGSLWAHKEADLAPHLGIGLGLQAGDVKKIPRALGFENLKFF